MASIFDPRTCSVTLSWRPTLEYYEQRVRVLKSFEEENLLAGFQVSDTQVIGRLHGGESLRIGPSAMTFDGLISDLAAFAGLFDDAAHRCLERLKPSLTGLSVTSRHIVSVEHLGDYDSARKRASRVFLGPFSDAANANDFAALVDASDPERDLKSHIEFGVVSRREGWQKLIGDLGMRQTSAPGSRAALREEVGQVEAIPQVGLFLESIVRPQSSPPQGTREATAWVSRCYRTAIAAGVDAIRALADILRDPEPITGEPTDGVSEDE